MAGGLNISYDEVESQCATLDRVVTDLEQSIAQMSNAVTTLCDGWTSQTSDQARNNYQSVVTNFRNTVGVVEELKLEIRNHVQKLQELDQSGAGVTVQ